MASKPRNYVTANPERCGSVDRTRRFIARVDAYLPTLADDAARRAFLDGQLEGWEHRYARFVATQGASEFAASAAGDPPQAADFLLTISALAARRSALGRGPRNLSGTSSVIEQGRRYPWRL